MPRQRKRKRDHRKSRSGYKGLPLDIRVRGARGKVWVPDLTQAAISERHQYWNKFKMTKEDELFREMQERFTKLALRKRDVDYPVSAVNSHDNFETSTIIRPYPSGSCHTIMAGNSSTFCIKPTLH